MSHFPTTVLYAQSTAALSLALGAWRTLLIFGLLGPSNFGIYSTLYNTASLLGAFAGLNTGEYLIKECPGRPAWYQRRALWFAWLLSLPGTIFGISLGCVWYNLGVFTFEINSLGYFYLSAAAILNTWLLILRGYLYGLEHIRTARTLNVLVNFAWFVLLAVSQCCVDNVTLTFIFGLWFVSDIALLIVFGWLYRDIVWRPASLPIWPTSIDSSISVRHVAAFCFALYPRTVAKTLFSLGDRYILVALGQLDALSALSLLKAAVGLATNCANVLSTVAAPRYYRLVNDRGLLATEPARSLAHLLLSSIVLTFPVVVGLIGFAPDIATWIGGNAVSTMVLWVAPVPLLWNLVTVLERPYIAYSRVGFLAAVELLNVGFYLFSAWIVVRLFGPPAIFPAMLSMFTLTLAILLLPGQMRHSIRWSKMPFWQLGLLAVGSITIIIPLARLDNVSIVVRVLACLLVYLGMLFSLAATISQAKEVLLTLSRPR